MATQIPAIKADQATMPLSMTAWMFIILWPVVVLALGVFYVSTVQKSTIAETVTPSTDIAVIDDVALIKMAIDNGANRYDSQAVMSEIHSMVERAGLTETILISQSMVMYAPDSSKIKLREKERDETASASRVIIQ